MRNPFSLINNALQQTPWLAHSLLIFSCHFLAGCFLMRTCLQATIRRLHIGEGGAGSTLYWGCDASLKAEMEIKMRLVTAPLSKQ